MDVIPGSSEYFSMSKISRVAYGDEGSQNSKSDDCDPSPSIFRLGHKDYMEFPQLEKNVCYYKDQSQCYIRQRTSIKLRHEDKKDPGHTMCNEA